MSISLRMSPIWMLNKTVNIDLSFIYLGMLATASPNNIYKNAEV